MTTPRTPIARGQGLTIYPSPVEVDISRDGDTSVIAVSGELDLWTAPDLSDAAVNALNEAGCHRLALDLSGLSFIDSSGINALIEIRDATHKADAALQISRLSARVAEVLRLTAVDDLFDIADA
jgi:anti-sigma B factor antagonist